MNNKLKYICIIFSVLFLAACEEEDKRTVFPQSTPVIETATVTSTDSQNPGVLIFGDSIQFTASVSDEKTPLSTLKIDVVVSDNLVARKEVRTAGYESSVSEKFKIPFIASADDGTNVEVYLTLTNVEGNTTEMAIIDQVKANRPTGFANTLYMVLADGTVHNLSRVFGSQYDYQSGTLSIESTRVNFKIAEKLTTDNEIDYSGFVWGNANGELSTVDEESSYYEYSDPLIVKMKRWKFNLYSFAFDVEADRLNPVKVDGKQLTAESLNGIDYMSLTTTFTKDAEVSVTGISNLEGAINPDFFEYVSAEKVKFLGASGSYKILYNNATGFMYIEQPAAVYPDAMWICGTGMGFPQQTYAATTKWDWTNPADYIFCRKISDGVFQATFYAQSFDLKFFHQATWGGEEDSSTYTLTPSNLIKPGVNSESVPNGNWVAGDGFTAGVYRITINVNDKTTVLEQQ